MAEIALHSTPKLITPPFLHTFPQFLFIVIYIFINLSIFF